MKNIKNFDTFNENIDYNDDQLEIGIKIETEHLDVYEFFDDYLKSNNLEMPCTKEELYSMIAKAHLREIPDYYTRLIKMEKES